MNNRRIRNLISTCLVFLLLLPKAQADPSGRINELKILLVGDSLTAGMYFLNLSNESALQGWASQLLLTLGIEPDSPGLKNFYPTDNLSLTKKGFGFWGIRNIMELLPNLLVKVDPISNQNITAIPGQTLNEALNLSSNNHGNRSASWIFGRLLLNDNKTFIESIEQSDSTPNWIIVWLGSNDLLSSFGLIGDATPPDAAKFESDYRLLIKRLYAKFENKNDNNHLLLLTLPDVTKIPLFVTLPEGSINADGELFPEGTKTNSFLAEYRNKKFESSEVYTPEMLRTVQERVNSYNKAIKDVAEEFGGTIVDIHTLTKKLENTPEYKSSVYSYYSPDLHHPSFKLYSIIMKEVVKVMQEISVEELAINGEITKNFNELLPSSADLTPLESKRASSLMRATMLMMEDGRFPPRPSYRGAVEIGSRIIDRLNFNMIVSGGVDFSPVPVGSGWVSRFVLNSRLGLRYASKKKFNEISDFSAGYAIEPQGKWDWRRFELGLSVSNRAGLGLYSKVEWHQIYFKATNLISSNIAIEGGIRIGKLWGRTGHNGN